MRGRADRGTFGEGDPAMRERNSGPLRPLHQPLAPPQPTVRAIGTRRGIGQPALGSDSLKGSIGARSSNHDTCGTPQFADPLCGATATTRGFHVGVGAPS